MRELPANWSWQELGSVAKRITDGTHQPPQFTESGIPFLVIRNIIRGEIEWDGVNKWVSEETYREITKSCRPERGDVLYSAVGSYGVAVAVEDDRRFAFQRHIAHIKPLAELIIPKFIAFALNSPALRIRADQVARGVAQKTVTLGELRKFPIP